VTTPILSIDFETASQVDLRQTGAYAYAQSETTRVLCMAFAFDDGPVSVWREGQNFPATVSEHVRHLRPVRAWNAAFEYAVWNHTLSRQLANCPLHQMAPADLDLDQLHDTMAAAAYWGLPMKLDDAAPAAGLNVQKDKAGHALMMRMNKPRHVNKRTGEVRWWHEEDPAKFDQLADYCAQDVVVERAIANTIPELPEQERRIWLMDARINERGVGIDKPLVSSLTGLARQAQDATNAQVLRITGGDVRTATSTAAMLGYLTANGYPEDNLRKATVEARMPQPDCLGVERELLELRQSGAKTSTAKLARMLTAADPQDPADFGTVRGMLQYYGASRTGRWAGRLIQPQNMPRGSLGSAIDDAIAAVLSNTPLDIVELLYGAGLEVVSSCLRGCLRARRGKELVVLDFSQIEARVVAWLAGQTDILDVFKSGRDVYIYTAARVTGTPEDQITKNSPLRQLGKVLVLACGFGMAALKFRETAEGYGIELSEAEAATAVTGWRDANNKIVNFWWDLDRAARHAIENPRETFAVRHITFGMWRGHLLMRLPSGRTLCYRDAELRPQEDRPGDEITYMGINQYTRNWERLRTYGGKLAENATQAVARDAMADAMLAADERPELDLVLTVHDELVAEAPEGRPAVEAREIMEQIMLTPPVWAPDLPVDCDGWVGSRYRK